MLVFNVVDRALQVLQSVHSLCETGKVVGALNVVNGPGKVLEFVHVLLDLSKSMGSVNIVDCGSIKNNLFGWTLFMNSSISNIDMHNISKSYLNLILSKNLISALHTVSQDGVNQ